MTKEENQYNPITEPASYRWFNEKPKSENVKIESENERLKAALTEIMSMKIHAVDNNYMYAFNKCYHIADKALESQPPKQ